MSRKQPIYEYYAKGKRLYYIKYQNKTKRGFNSYNDAKRYLSMLEDKKYKLGCSVTYHDVANEYLNDIYNEKSFGTYEKRKRMFDAYIFPYVGNKKISTFDELDCKRFRDTIYKLEKSSTYKNDILMCFKKIFVYACQYYNLNNNPCSYLQTIKKTDKEKLSKISKDLNIWTQEDFDRFISKVSNEKYRIMFILIFNTGIRIGECQALKWKDLVGNKLSINKSITKHTEKHSYEIKSTKTLSSVRDILIDNVTLKLLLNYKEKEMIVPSFNEDWFIFGRMEPTPRTNIERIKNNACKEANVRKIRIHDFRHSHASNLIGNGLDITSVSKRLGHRNVTTTLETYTHCLTKNEDKITSYLECSSQNLLMIEFDN